MGQLEMCTRKCVFQNDSLAIDVYSKFVVVCQEFDQRWGHLSTHVFLSIWSCTHTHTHTHTRRSLFTVQ